jgi:ATP/maltotriose-dependent transcriptional regulator MalT
MAPLMSLPRERLTALLAESALTSVELVIAPPGFGKTTVLREYAGTDGGAVFIALPEATDLEAFVRAVIAAAVPAALHSIGGVFDGPSEQNVEERAGEWLVSRLRDFNGTLIVDDFHRASADERVARMLVAAIAATHGRMRWIVASRESPPFPMGSWIARGWMGLPITGDDLAFTVGEANELAASLEIAASGADLTAIVEDTLGWPIGIRLALSLVARKRGAGQTRVQTRDALFALLEDEVWQPLDPGLRGLIIAAAMMPNPSIATLIASGFTGARDGMAQVFAKVPFIAAIDEDAFAIHDLFREFVAAQALRAHLSTDRLAVASALVTTGNPADGLRLFITAGDVEGVRNALARHAFFLLETGQRSAVSAGIAFLSEHGLSDDGVALALRGALAFSDGSGANAANLFLRALQRNAPQEMRCEVTRRLAVSYVNRGDAQAALDLLAPCIDDPALTPEERLEMRAFHIAVRASTAPTEHIVREIEEIDRLLPSVSPGTQARILQRLANAAFGLGDLDAAERYAQSAASLAIDLGADTLAAHSYNMLYAVAGHVDENAQRARTFLRAQIAAAERAGSISIRVLALRAEYAIAATNAEFETAGKTDALLAQLVDARVYRDPFAHRIGRALLQAASGEIRKAEATLATASPPSMTPADQAFRDSLVTVLMLARGDRAAAEAGLERGILVEAASEYHNRAQLDYAYALRAVAFWTLDRPLQARKSFGFDAARLARRDRILIEALRALTELRHPLTNRDEVAPLCQMLEAADFSAYATLLRRLVERDANEIELSATEIETLRIFDRYGGRATDVAKALGKSKYTIQNQIQSAIKKIGCSGRAEALAYARSRGWLDTTDS